MFFEVKPGFWHFWRIIRRQQGHFIRQHAALQAAQKLNVQVLADKTQGKEPIYPYFRHFYAAFSFILAPKARLFKMLQPQSGCNIRVSDRRGKAIRSTPPRALNRRTGVCAITASSARSQRQRVRGFVEHKVTVCKKCWRT